jgi:hypothetical protein
MVALAVVTVFFSAFLLFQIQPVIAKLILPWFGGSSAVWSVCMLFFQMGLLAGYAYAHWTSTRLRPRRQAQLHILLLAASLLALPVIPAAAWKPAGGEDPVWRILGLLAATVGLPYFMLAATSPLVQVWYARARGVAPYRLFAVSNAASLGALLSYPFLIEPHLSTRWQAGGWSWAYCLFAVLCAAMAWRGARFERVEAGAASAADEAEAAPAWLWMALAACPSILLLAFTTYLTQDVASIPFLWILPLSVYLLSFILCFESSRYYRRWLFLPALALALGGMGWLAQNQTSKLPIVWSVSAVGAILFVIAMACHGELARLKPHPSRLTAYYLMIAVGGAVGGLFVGLLAPHVFNGYYELPVGLVLTAALVPLAAMRGRRVRAVWRCAAAGLALGYAGWMGWTIRTSVSGYRITARNFYGQLRVYDSSDEYTGETSRALVHGVINHGEQVLGDAYRLQPISYFCPETGIGRILRASEGRPRRIGILGLGCGTLAAYGRAGDTVRIYEINPLILDLARKEFSYLRDTPAKVEVALGDGRLSLERDPPQGFDVLVMDAFSGDSVPVHLITREAFALYFSHLKPGGVLAVNISNRYLDLDPVIGAAARAFGKICLVFHFTPEEDNSLCFGCSWALVMDEQTRREYSSALATGEVVSPRPHFRSWTDDYSSLYGIMH